MYLKKLVFICSLVVTAVHGQELVISLTKPTEELLRICRNNGPECTVEEAKKLLEQGALIGYSDDTFPAFEWAAFHGRTDLCELFLDELENNVPLIDYRSQTFEPNTDLRRIKQTYQVYFKQRRYKRDCLAFIKKMRLAQHSLRKQIQILQEINAKQSGDRFEKRFFSTIAETALIPHVALAIALRYAVAGNKPALVTELLKGGVSLQFTYDDHNLDESWCKELATKSGEEVIEVLKKEDIADDQFCSMPWHCTPHYTYSGSSEPIDSETEQLLQLLRSNKITIGKQASTLIRNGAHVDTPDKDGLTALHWALIRYVRLQSADEYPWILLLEPYYARLFNQAFITQEDAITVSRDPHVSVSESEKALVVEQMLLVLGQRSVGTDRSLSKAISRFEYNPFVDCGLQENKLHKIPLKNLLEEILVPVIIYLDSLCSYERVLQQAISSKNSRLCQAVIEAGADLRDSQDPEHDHRSENAHFRRAIRSESLEIVTLFMAAGLNAKDYISGGYEASLLHTACSRRFWPCVALLLQKGVVLNCIDHNFERTCWSYFSPDELEKFKEVFVQASIKRYAPSYEEFVAAHKKIIGVVAALYDVSQELDAVMSILENSPDHLASLITVFHYALTCSPKQLEIIFGKNLANPKLRAYVYHLMYSLFASLKNNPAMISYLRECMESEEVLQASSPNRSVPLKSLMHFDEALVKKTIDTHYNEMKSALSKKIYT